MKNINFKKPISIFMVITFINILFFSAFNVQGHSNNNNFYQKYGIFKEGDFKIPDTYKSFYAKSSTSLKSSKLIIIDPGHGGIDAGAKNSTLLEKDISLDIAQNLKNLLDNINIQSEMTRNNDSYIDVKKRIDFANEKNANLFLSIHCNWFKEPEDNGITTLINMKNIEKYVNYAEILQSELIGVLDMKNMGIQERDDLVVLKYANMPSFIVEIGFLSNIHDVYLLNSAEFRKNAAKALLNAITKIFQQL